MRYSLTAGAAGLLALSVPATAQSFTNNTTDIPTGAPFNNSRTENVDFGDVDLDGDWDAIFGDGGDAVSDQNRIWINQGGLQAGAIGSFVDETASQLPNFADQSRDIEFVDLDNDSDLDIYVSNTAQISNQGNRWLINEGGLQGGTLGFYVDETAARWVGLNSASSSISDSLLLPDAVNPETFIDWSCDCDFGDLDNDGDLDLVHSSYGGAFGGQVPTRLFLNEEGFFEEFNPSNFKLTTQNIVVGNPGLWCEGTQQTNTGVSDGTRCDVATSTLDIDIGDTDGDFDLDILHGDREQAPRFFQNRLEEKGGTLGFRDVSSAVFPAGYSSGNGHYEQEMADMDNDGDLDIYGLNWDAGGFNFNDVTLENDGSGNFTNFTVLAGSGSDDNEGDFIDYDNDGDLDLFIANFSGANRLYRNNNNGGGSGFNFTNVSGSELPSVSGLTSLDADAADVDGDGDYDIFESNDFNAVNRYFENVTQVPDTSAPSIPNVEAIAGNVASSRDDAFRVHVYDNAPYYITWYNTTNVAVTVEDIAIGNFSMQSSAGQVFRGEVPGNLVGDVEYTVSSSDEYGNVGTSATSQYTNTGDTGIESGDTSPSSVGTPRLRALSQPMAGQQMYVAASGVAPGTPGTLFVSNSSMASVDTGDGVILSVGSLLLPAVELLSNADGVSLVSVERINPGLAGVTLYLQYFGMDGVGGAAFASSNRLELTF